MTSGRGEEERKQREGGRLASFSGCSISTYAVNYYSTVRDWKQGKAFVPETNSKGIMSVNMLNAIHPGATSYLCLLTSLPAYLCQGRLHDEEGLMEMPSARDPSLHGTLDHSAPRSDAQNGSATSQCLSYSKGDHRLLSHPKVRRPRQPLKQAARSSREQEKR